MSNGDATSKEGKDNEISSVMAVLQLVGMTPGDFSPTESQLAEAWVMLGLISVAPIVEEVFE